MNFLSALPAEISLSIIDNLEWDDRRNFSYCSKFCYNFFLPIRFASVTLNRFSIPLFQDGGACELGRDSIHSIRCEYNLSEESRRNWRHRMMNLHEKLRKDNDSPKMRKDFLAQDVENLITEIRDSIAVLNLFPNVRELCIAYQVPPCMDKNIFAAILRELSLELYHNLQHLDLQCYKELTKFYSRQRDDIGFRGIYRQLSIEARAFIGQKIENDDIKDLITKLTPTLHSLTRAEITLNTSMVPLSDTKFFEQSAFYYVPFSLAPNLENLCIRVGGIEEPRYKVDDGLDDELLGIFGGIKCLKVVKWLMGAQKPQINTYNYGYEGR
ncbi:hypothetical protein TWF281_008914 [Arthrobotrys megalospora]